MAIVCAAAATLPGILIGQHLDESGARHVRGSPPRTPEEEKRAFRFPPGFSIELYACEPDIGKPMNIAFDASGRLWVTQSAEYPIAAADGKGRDKLIVIEDTDGDGRGDRFTEFANDLNIPIGIQPMTDGAVVYTIPRLTRLYSKDVREEGAAARVTLAGPFGYADTHGMVNNLLRGFDGWIHACHGFNNTSAVSARDGRELILQSGSTFRIAPDGSRMEITTTGRVNPFGLAYDEWGYLYSSDCHSTPIYQLIRSANYPTFHSEASGIGYGPRMMKHNHGPTAVAGLVFYTANHFPRKFQNSFYTGNVVSNRIKRDSIEWRGSTPVAVKEEDFLVSDDPWFRPVDLKVGPDGALYVADFYNRIIGHYEVPLDHPGRDRVRGRIWRISWTGGDDDPTSDTETAPPDLRAAEAGELLEYLGHPDLSMRFLAANELTDRIGAKAIPVLLEAARDPSDQPERDVMILWVLHRLDALPWELLMAAAESSAPLLRVHALRVLREAPARTSGARAVASNALNDSNPHVRRAAAAALATMPAAEHVKPLLASLSATPAGDTHLRYTIRQALRDTLRREEILAMTVASEWTSEEAESLAGILIGVDHPAAAGFLIEHLSRAGVNSPATRRRLRHAALHVPEASMAELVRLCLDLGETDLDFEANLLETLLDAITRRGLTPSSEVVDWGVAVARVLLASSNSEEWVFIDHDDGAAGHDPWTVRPVKSDDGAEAPFLTSRWLDERWTGTLRSRPFRLPGKMIFYVAGHAGPPGNPAHTKNRVRLLLAGGDILRQAFPPRADIAERVEWTFREHAGRLARLELVDGDPAGAYAWIGAGRFNIRDLAVPNEGTGDIRLQRLRGIAIARALGRQELVEDVTRIVSSSLENTDVRARAIELLAEMGSDAAPSVLASALAAENPLEVREAAAAALARSPSESAMETLVQTGTALPRPLQARVAEELAASETGRIRLLDLVDAGALPGGLLANPGIAARFAEDSRGSVATRYRAIAGSDAEARVQLKKTIDATVASFDLAAANPGAGQVQFARHCAACHAVRGSGGRVGPQLDGIGGRGAASLIEKILDPNRSVAESFRFSTLRLADGKTVSGMVKREEGQVLVLADATGKEVVVPAGDVVDRRESPVSLMPAIFGDILSEEEIHDLVAWLLELQ